MTSRLESARDMTREEEIGTEESERSQSSTPESPPEHAVQGQERLCDAWTLAPIILAVLMALVMMKISTPTVLKPKIWTAEELSQYNGSDPSQPLLVSILGSVFDVSRGRNHYGPGGGYHHFTGRDASRAFVSGNFTGGGLTNSMDGLSPQQIKSIHDWQIFFKKKYIYVGTMVGRFYDEHGKPTKALVKVARQVASAEKAAEAQKRDEERFPACNSRWNPNDGGQVWCGVGYPRIVEKVSEGTYKGTPAQTRCACYEAKFLHRKGLRLYEGCSAISQRCQSAPPELKQS